RIRLLTSAATGIFGSHTKSSAKNFYEAAIFLDRQNFAGVLHQKLGEGAEAGADFEDFVRFGKFRGFDDAAKLVAVVQEILAERFRELDVLTRQQVSHFGKFHGRFPIQQETSNIQHRTSNIQSLCPLSPERLLSPA